MDLEKTIAAAAIRMLGRIEHRLSRYRRNRPLTKGQGMLILSRGVGEVVQVGFGELAGFVRVLQIRGHKIRLGFDFPDSVSINRLEVVARIEAARPGTEVDLE